MWHRDRLPTITVRADLGDGMLPAAVTAQIDPTLDGIRAQLPQGVIKLYFPVSSPPASSLKR